MTPPAELFAEFCREPALFSLGRNHRYWLCRTRGPADMFPTGPEGRVLFVMLNPSVAGESADDQTVRKLQGFARPLGGFRVGVVNLFSAISTEPLGLMRMAQANGTDADSALEAGMMWLRDGPGVKHATRLVFAYGKPPWADAKGPGLKRAMLADTVARIRKVRGLALEYGHAPAALGFTAEGWPRHPSRLGYAVRPELVPDSHFARLDALLTP
jgi:hypothetical protein